MKKPSLIFLLLLTWVLISVSVSIQAQFVTIARKIKTMRTGQSDIATVLIDARPFLVYQSVMDTLKSNPKFNIIRKEPSGNSVEFSVKTYTITMKVDSLAANLSQITVSAAPPGDSEKQATSMAVEAIMGVCHKAGIKCTIDQK